MFCTAKSHVSTAVFNSGKHIMFILNYSCMRGGGKYVHLPFIVDSAGQFNNNTPII